MSETDDTDELILIPPDFFSTGEPFFEDRYFEVVDSLITQVTILENRINSIENQSDLESISPKSSYMSSVRKHRSSDDVTRLQSKDAFESTQSTPQKPQTRRVTSSVNLFAGRNLNFGDKNESKRYNSKVSALKEIDQYIVNIEEGLGRNENRENDEEKDDKREKIKNHYLRNSLDMKDLDFMLKKIENQQKEFDLLMNKNDFTENLINPSLNNDQSSIDHDLSNLNESSCSSSESTQITTIPNRLAAGSDFVQPSKSNIRRKPTSSNTTTAQNLNRTQQTQRKHSRFKSQTETEMTSTTRGSESSFQSHSERPNRYFNEYRTGSERFYDMTGFDDYGRKLEEERMRRQRCEQIIQQLRTKTLDLQDQLSEAIRIDEAKDDAIFRFHKAWEQVAVRLQTLVTERNVLEGEIKEIQSEHTRNLAEAAEKLAQYEAELQKSFLITQTTQEKNRELEKLIIDLTNEIQRLNKKIEGLEKELKVEDDGCSELRESLGKKEEELKRVNEELTRVKGEIENEKRKSSNFEREIGTLREEFGKLKEEKDSFDRVVKERDGLIDTLEKQNQKLLTEIDVHKNKENDLQKELTITKESKDKEKLDLKYFYQEQVERVVKEKLLDFQVQLERARGELEEDLKKREVIVAKTAATHIQQIADKHALEIRLLEEKHLEQIRLYQVQVTQAQQLVDNLQHKLQHQQMRKQQMAKQLHKLMEAQWLEALKIINNGRSPVTDGDLTNQLNLLKSKSYNNMEEVLEMGMDEVQEQNFNKNGQNGSGGNGKQGINNQYQNTNQQYQNTNQQYQSTNQQYQNTNQQYQNTNQQYQNTTQQYQKIQQNNHQSMNYQQVPNQRVPVDMYNMETPLTSRPRPNNMEDVQKYLHMLMNKQSGSPTGDHPATTMGVRNAGGNGQVDYSSWQQQGQDENRAKMKEKKIKPPWK